MLNLGKNNAFSNKQPYRKWKDMLKEIVPCFSLIDRQCHISYMVNMVYIIMSQRI